MIESFKGRRWTGRIAAALGATALAAGLAGCGGGDRDEPFKPTRIIVFGDEYSAVVTSDSSKAQFTVNYKVKTETAFRCEQNPIWTHYLAAHYGLPLPGCATGASAGVSYATAGARVNNVSSQIDAAIGAGGFRSGDVATVLAGANDIKDAMANYPATPLDTLRATVRAAGETLGTKTRTIVNGGAKVLVVTVPDLGPTPYGIAQNGGSATPGGDFLNVDCSSDPGSNPQKVLSVLTACFNNGLRTTMTQDGTKAALVVADQLIRGIVNAPADYGITNIVTPLCKTTTTFSPTNTCYIQFLDTNETTDSTTWDQLNTTSTSDLNYWLWAGDIYLSPIGNTKLGSAAVSRSQSNWE